MKYEKTIRINWDVKMKLMGAAAFMCAFLSSGPLLAESRIGTADLGTRLLAGFDNYDGSRASFDERFFPDELRPGFRIDEAWLLPNVEDPMAWQGHFTYVEGAFGGGWLCTQYGLRTLEEIDAQDSNGTPLIFRDTLLRRNVDQGYNAKLNCEFKVLDFENADDELDAFNSLLSDLSEQVDVSTEAKTAVDLPYNQHVIAVKELIGASGVRVVDLKIIINDFEGNEDNVRGSFVALIRQRPS